MKHPLLVVLLVLAPGLMAQAPTPPEDPDLVLPSMILEVKDQQGPVLGGFWTPEWDVPLPDAAYVLPAPSPLKEQELADLFAASTALLPTGSPALPPDWNLLTSLGFLLGAPYHFGLDVGLMRIGKTLPFRLEFRHAAEDSYWNGRVFQKPGDGFSRRETRMNFDIAKDPARTWGVKLGLEESSQGLQKQTSEFFSTENRNAWLGGEYRLPLPHQLSLSLGGSGRFTQKVLSGGVPESASILQGELLAGLLLSLGDWGDARLSLLGTGSALTSDVQPRQGNPGGGLDYGFQLFFAPGWTLQAQGKAAWDHEQFVFPVLGKLLGRGEVLTWELSGGFIQTPPQTLWSRDPVASLILPEDMEASGQVSTRLTWTVEPALQLALSGAYRGGWLYEPAAWDLRTAQRTYQTETHHRWETGLSGQHKAWGVWGNTLSGASVWKDGLWNEGRHSLEWTTAWNPEGGSWTVDHRLQVVYQEGWSPAQGDLRVQWVPSPLFTLETGLRDWTSVVLGQGRVLEDSPYLAPGFQFYVSGKLNL